MNEPVFNTDIDYPPMADLLENGLDDGVWYCYVTSTYVSAHLPYLLGSEQGDANKGVLILAALLQRYRAHSDSEDPSDRPITDKEIASIIEGWAHPRLGDFEDDVVLLCETRNYWWVLHLDQDVSDCCIGRWPKEHFSLEKMESSVRSYCQNIDDGCPEWTVRAWLPISSLCRGWPSF